MKQWTFSCLRKSVLVLLMLLMALAFTVITVSADDKTPTRTDQLDLAQYTTTVDNLDSEGWKYEPSENGGTLTLHDFYLKGDHSLNYGAGLIRGKGTITIVLEGTNVIETTSNFYKYLIGNNIKNDVSWIIKESGNKGTLELKNGSGSIKEGDNPYGFSGKDLTIESGTIVSDMEFCSLGNDFTLREGLLTITIPKEVTSTDVSAIYVERNTIINGGTLKISQGACGITTGYYDGEGFVLNDGNVEINANRLAIGMLDSAKQPKLKGGYLVAAGGIRATNAVIDASEYQGEGFTRGSANLDGSDAVTYDPENYKTYKWIEFPHVHKASGNWISNDTEHWKLCSCGEKMESGEHSFGEWKVIKEAAVGAKGEKARQCEVCGFEEKQDIPAVAATDSNNGGSSAKSAKTGDSTNLWIPFLLTLLSAAGIGGTVIMRRKSL